MKEVHNIHSHKIKTVEQEIRTTTLERKLQDLCISTTAYLDLRLIQC
jgi:hypothetical protein